MQRQPSHGPHLCLSARCCPGLQGHHHPAAGRCTAGATGSAGETHTNTLQLKIHRRHLFCAFLLAKTNEAHFRQTRDPLKVKLRKYSAEEIMKKCCGDKERWLLRLPGTHMGQSDFSGKQGVELPCTIP